ncbi:membrane protein [Liquorilactobacillus sucicola DSM 21376 = JCM 15457]|uniref:Teichoic acid polysaccharide export protein n=1 Tax=Liquorilactobacillus sucicola DSM 21376 = JCM 15457 TaxID=1423806 RepID=A0A023CWT5_9LACO|nr:oligosaccharide flippase family protein [Liquorilactobacillus sucicola]KRN06325.1 teichoic acid polysaccharide export protein [Liquorilactobacillus sucicola DSM 21376 = JCM 15457]GAJ26269.1 membrane protein [Liquorilactobacillus sucicola DSM 21376 = JCM 15457]
MKKIFKNFLYQATYQLLLIILPFVTIPIVSNALGVKGIGIYNYVNSIITYFTLVAGLGLANYGIREIASVRENKNLLNKKFSELLQFNIIISLFVTAFFVFFVLVLSRYQVYFLIAGLSIIACVFDISWFFAGIEDFKVVTLSNFAIKLISLFLIVVFVNSTDDLFKYLFIQAASSVISNVLMFLFLKGKVKLVKVTLGEVFSHFKPAVNYFYGNVAITLYTTLSKTFLGLMVSVAIVGLYSNSIQLTSIVVVIITTLDTVLMPRLTYLFESNNFAKMISVIEQTFHVQLFFSIPAMCGLIAINNKLIPWFFGKSFSYLTYTVPALAPLVVIIPLGTSVMRQYLMPKNEFRKFNFSVYVGAIIGVTTNLMLIPIFKIWGAVIASLLAEVAVTYLRLRYLFSETSFTFSKKKIAGYVFSGIVMGVAIYTLTAKMPSVAMTTLIQIILGGIIYCILTLFLRVNPLIQIFKDVFKK